MAGEGVGVVDDMAEGWRLVVAWLEDEGGGAWRELVGVRGGDMASISLGGERLGKPSIYLGFFLQIFSWYIYVLNFLELEFSMNFHLFYDTCCILSDGVHKDDSEGYLVRNGLRLLICSTWYSPVCQSKDENAWQTQIEDVWDRDMLKILNVEKTSNSFISSQARSLKGPYTAPNLRSDHLTLSTMQTVKQSQILVYSKHE